MTKKIRNIEQIQRYKNCPPRRIKFSFFEAINNLLTFVKNFGTFEYIRRGKNADYIFYNNLSQEHAKNNIELDRILEMAGASISCNEGNSLCGMGIETFALSFRPKDNSKVTVKIETAKDGIVYTGFIYYMEPEAPFIETGATRQITDNEEKNWWKISFLDCHPMKKDEEKIFMDKIREKIYQKNKVRETPINIVYIKEDGHNKREEKKLNPVDMIYEDDLKGTDNFLELKAYYTLNGERKYIIIKVADVYDIVKTDKANDIDKRTSKLDPEFCGPRFVFNGDMSIQGGKLSAEFIKRKYHNTEDNIRTLIDVLDNREIYEMVHKNSVIKNDPTKANSIFDLVNENDEPLIFENENGEPIENILTNFISSHSIDQKNKLDKDNIEEITVQEKLNVAINDALLGVSEETKKKMLSRKLSTFFNKKTEKPAV